MFSIPEGLHVDSQMAPSAIGVPHLMLFMTVCSLRSWKCHQLILLFFPGMVCFKSRKHMTIKTLKLLILAELLKNTSVFFGGPD